MSEENIKQEAAAAPAAAAETEAAATAADGEAAAKKGRPRKSIPPGIAFIRSTFNNTQVSIADARGGVIAWSSAGKAGFKGSRKCTAFAATMVAQDVRQGHARVRGARAGRRRGPRVGRARHPGRRHSRNHDHGLHARSS